MLICLMRTKLGGNEKKIHSSVNYSPPECVPCRESFFLVLSKYIISYTFMIENVFFNVINIV